MSSAVDKDTASAPSCNYCWCCSGQSCRISCWFFGGTYWPRCERAVGRRRRCSRILPRPRPLAVLGDPMTIASTIAIHSIPAGCRRRGGCRHAADRRRRCSWSGGSEKSAARRSSIGALPPAACTQTTMRGSDSMFVCACICHATRQLPTAHRFGQRCLPDRGATEAAAPTCFARRTHVTWLSTHLGSKLPCCLPDRSAAEAARDARGSI